MGVSRKTTLPSDSHPGNVEASSYLASTRSARGQHTVSIGIGISIGMASARQAASCDERIPASAREFSMCACWVLCCVVCVRARMCCVACCVLCAVCCVLCVACAWSSRLRHHGCVRHRAVDLDRRVHPATRHRLEVLVAIPFKKSTPAVTHERRPTRSRSLVCTCDAPPMRAYVHVS